MTGATTSTDPWAGGRYPGGSGGSGGQPPVGGEDNETAAELLRRAVSRSPLGRIAPALASRPVVDLALIASVAATVFVAATPIGGGYRVPWTIGLLVAASVGSTLVAFSAGRLLRLSAVFSYAASVLGLVVLLVAACGLHPVTVAHAVGHTPERLLSETLPLTGGRAILAAPLILVWVAGAATTEILVRALGRPGTGPAGLGVPIMLYVAFFAVTSAAPSHAYAAGPVLLILVAVTAAVWRQVAIGPDTAVTADSTVAPGESDNRPPSRSRPAATALLAAAVVAAVLAGVAPHVDGLSGSRSAVHRQPPIVTPTVVDPVDSMAAIRDTSPSAAAVGELTVTFAQPSDGYLGVADLNDYDGAEWQFDASFDPTGGRVPEVAGTADVNGLVTQHIVITGAIPVPLLPALDRPESVEGLAAAADPRTGMLLPQTTRSHLAYTVVSETPDAVLSGLTSADGIESEGPADLELPADTSADLATMERFMAGLTATRPAATLTFLQACLQALQSKEKRVVPETTAVTQQPPTKKSRSSKSAATTTTTLPPPASAGGTSLSEVINAVTVSRAASPEQFATFFAMIARYLGVPARVVTGFRVPPTSSGSLVSPGRYSVTNQQAWTWVEIPVAGFGWVVADPTPDGTTVSTAPPPEAVQAPSTTLPNRGATVVPRGLGQGGHALAPPSHIKIPAPAPDHVWDYVGFAVIGLVLLLLLVGPGQAGVRRSVRRRIRKRGSAPSRAVGAWLELLDSLDRIGVRPAPGATSTEVADEIGLTLGAELAPAVRSIGATADQAVFSVSRPVSDDSATRSWELQRQTRRMISATLDHRQRLASWLRVGSSPTRPLARRPVPPRA